MRKAIVFVLALLILCGALLGCAAQGGADAVTPTDAEKKAVEKSFEIFRAGWTDWLNERVSDAGEYVIDVKNVRIVKLKENDKDRLKDVDFIVEFLFYMNYYQPGDAYSQSVNMNDSIAFYKDGTAKLENRLIYAYQMMSYDVDTSGYIEEVRDFGAAFNRKLTIVKE